MTIAANSTSNLLVQFQPAAQGLRTAVVKLYTNLSATPVYQFAVQGTGTPPAGVVNTLVDEGFQLFPNPAQDLVSVQLQLAHSGTVSAAIRDLSGRLLGTPVTVKNASGMQTLMLDVKALPEGLYLVEVVADGTIYRSKLHVKH